MRTIFITGAAGYVGAMLVDRLSQLDTVGTIIGLDKEPVPDLIRHNPKLVYLQANTSDAGWEKTVSSYSPNVVIHTAWQIREMYGNQKLQWKWNVEGSDKVFDFAFSTPSVQKLIHFSTVASYGAFSQNSLDHFYMEDEPFRKSKYLYAEEKRIVEEHLKEKYETTKKGGTSCRVCIIRPAAITGPRGRYVRIRFGLQSALSGTLRAEKSFAYALVSAMVSFVPVTKKWLRQYVHEDDVTDIVTLLTLEERENAYEAFNLAPPGDAVLGKDMAAAVGKKILPVQPWMIRIVFYVMWHFTRGKIPTASGSWRGYSYPIAVDGSKITRLYGYRYRVQSKDAFVKNEGRYKVDVIPS